MPKAGQHESDLTMRRKKFGKRSNYLLLKLWLKLCSKIKCRLKTRNLIPTIWQHITGRQICMILVDAVHRKECLGRRNNLFKKCAVSNDQLGSYS